MYKRLLYCLILVLVFGVYISAHAQTPELTNGLNYLSSSQNPDGSWGGEASSMPSLPSTVSVLNAYKAMNQADAPSYQPALSWLQSQSLNTTDYLSERILILAGQNDTNTLLSYFDYGWGGYAYYDVNNLDTALALHALKSVSYTGTNIITPAISRLISSQNSDGGWTVQNPAVCPTPNGCIFPKGLNRLIIFWASSLPKDITSCQSLS